VAREIGERRSVASRLGRVNARCDPAPAPVGRAW